MKKSALTLVAALSLSGCDAMQDLGSSVAKAYPEHAPMTLVIHSDYKMLVGGQQAQVFGSDVCPPADNLFGSDPDEGTRSCVVITPETKTVSVTVQLSEGPSKESWTVERSGDRTMLRRADGTLLAAAK